MPFDWENCPKKFHETFLKASDTSELDLNSQSIVDAEIFIIVSFLNTHPAIKTLRMNDNLIKSQGAMILGQNTTLEVLFLNRNKIDDKGAIALAKNTNFKTLHLSGNQITEVGAAAFMNNQTLLKLNLSVNNISSPGFMFLSHNQRLTTLDIRDNKDGIMRSAWALMQCKQNRDDANTSWQAQKLAFLCGFYKTENTPSIIAKLYDKLVQKIFQFVTPYPPMTLLHSFPKNYITLFAPDPTHIPTHAEIKTAPSFQEYESIELENAAAQQIKQGSVHLEEQDDTIAPRPGKKQKAQDYRFT
jgi:hypothetical protein